MVKLYYNLYFNIYSKQTLNTGTIFFQTYSCKQEQIAWASKTPINIGKKVIKAAEQSTSSMFKQNVTKTSHSHNNQLIQSHQPLSGIVNLETFKLIRDKKEAVSKRQTSSMFTQKNPNKQTYPHWKARKQPPAAKNPQAAREGPVSGRDRKSWGPGKSSKMGAPSVSLGKVTEKPARGGGSALLHS